MKSVNLLFRVALWGLASVGLLFLLVTFTPFVSWYALRLAGPWYAAEGNVLVVLSAAGSNLGVIDPATYWRCTYALAADRHHHFDKIIVSGKDTALVMRDFLVYNGIGADRILVENQSTSTYQNAVFTARILTGLPGRKILLTSDSHMFRAQRSFARQGVQTVPSPIPDVLKQVSDYNSRWPLFAREVSETARIIYYFYRGWI